MTEAPLDTYIKSPPPADERSHFNYLEDQLTKLENVSKKHVVRIADNNESAKALVQQEYNARVSGDEAQAQYTLTVAAQTLNSASALVQQETTARTTADTALASQITTLNANVGTLSGAITSEASLRVTADEALGTRIDNLVLTNGSDAAVIIDSEASARITADYALGARIDSLTTTVNSNTAAISTEQTTRSTRDDALAKQLFTMSSGSARIYVATSAPSSSGRQAGDVWFDSSTNNYKPYVWARSTPSATTGSYDWRDNSDGSFTNLVGNYAVYTNAISTLTNATTSQASSITALQTTVGNSTAGLVKDVTALTTAVGDSSSGLVKDVTTLQSTSATVSALNTEATARANADAANTAAITTEQSARTTADTALASYLMSASAGTTRVYTSDPGSTSRQNGDVWIRANESNKPYVWYNSTWNDGTSGNYAQYIGQMASVTTTANAAYSTATSANSLATTTATQVTTLNATVNNNYNTLNGAISSEANTRASQDGVLSSRIDNVSATVTNNYNTLNASVSSEATARANADSSLSSRIDTVTATANNTSASIGTIQTAQANINGALSTQWAIVGSLGGPSSNILTIDGARKSDGSTGAYSVAINANVLINGTLTAEKIVDKSVSNVKIADNAVSSSGFNETASSNTTDLSTTVTVRPNGRVQVLAVLETGSTVRKLSKQWKQGQTEVPASDGTGNRLIGYLNVTRSISGQSSVVKSYKIMGYCPDTATGTAYDYIDFNNSANNVLHRYWDYDPNTVTAVMYYYNPSSTSSVDVTFSVTATDGQNSGSSLTTSRTVSATELSK